MKFTIVVRETREVPAAEVAEIAEVLRGRFELAEGAPSAAENILMEASARGLIELPESFSMDEGEEADVTAEEIAEAVEDEAEGEGAG